MKRNSIISTPITQCPQHRMPPKLAHLIINTIHHHVWYTMFEDLLICHTRQLICNSNLDIHKAMCQHVSHAFCDYSSTSHDSLCLHCSEARQTCVSNCMLSIKNTMHSFVHPFPQAKITTKFQMEGFSTSPGLSNKILSSEK